MALYHTVISNYKYPLLYSAKGAYIVVGLLFAFSVFNYTPPPQPIRPTNTVIEKWQPPIPKPYSLPASLNPPAAIAAPIPSQPSTIMNPFISLPLYYHSYSRAKNQADAWRADRPADAAMIDKIAAQPTAVWLGDWTPNVEQEASTITSAAAAGNSLPVLVAYNIPGRDCGNYSSGGAASADAYRNWIKNLASGIGSRRAVVVLEPDSLGVIDCLTPTELSNRYQLIASAVQTLRANPKTYVYIDAGHTNWVPAAEMALRLKRSGIDQATGFALNVSNFYTDAQENHYGRSISKLVGGKHYIIDSSRNGLGWNGQWCNPEGRALGTKPQVGSGLLDAYLWIKTPGESDGTCNGGPPAGVWWPEYALGLASRASY